MGGERCPRPDRAHACLEELTVDQVFEAASRAIDARNTR
jgi:hypothetical protein